MALNFQTHCSEMDLNQGRFLANGKSGYILKPTFMREPRTEFDPITLTRGDWLQHKTLHVMVRFCEPRHSLSPLLCLYRLNSCVTTTVIICRQVISGQQLPKVNDKKSSIVDPLVKVQVHGVAADVAEKQTNAIENNGIYLPLYLFGFLSSHWCHLVVIVLNSQQIQQWGCDLF